MLIVSDRSYWSFRVISEWYFVKNILVMNQPYWRWCTIIILKLRQCLYVNVDSKWLFLVIVSSDLRVMFCEEYSCYQSTLLTLMSIYDFTIKTMYSCKCWCEWSFRVMFCEEKATHMDRFVLPLVRRPSKLFKIAKTLRFRNTSLSNILNDSSHDNMVRAMRNSWGECHADHTTAAVYTFYYKFRLVSFNLCYVLLCDLCKFIIPFINKRAKFIKHSVYYFHYACYGRILIWTTLVVVLDVNV
jgi:hypothetical protein